MKMFGPSHVQTGTQMQPGHVPVQGTVQFGLEPKACTLSSIPLTSGAVAHIPYLVDNNQNQPPRCSAFSQYISRI